MISKSKKYNIILLGLFLLFLFFYNFNNIFLWWPLANTYGHLIFNWPDASANYYFAKLFAESGVLASFEPLNLLSDNLIHARSVNVVSANLVPITFLPALALFGSAFRLLGDLGVLFFTPLLSALSGLLVYRISYYIFKDLDLSLLTAILFWSLAPVIFFSNIVMLPQMLFIFTILAGWYSIAKYFYKRKTFYWLLGSLFLSLAVFIRPSEILWLSFISIFVVYINRDKINWLKYLYGGLIFLATAAWFLYLNKITYGGYLSFGYMNLQSGDIASEASLSVEASLWDYIKILFFPFGFDVVLILKNFYKYFIAIIPSQVILAVLALGIMFYKKSLNFVWKKYLLLTPFVFLLIVIYYASWDLADPLVKELNKISISYVRYFLPLYIWILPLTAWAIKKIFYGQSKINKWSYYIIIFAIVLSSVKFAFMAKYDGLLAMGDNIRDYYQQYSIVSSEIDDDSVIISSREDKIFWPKYKVVVEQGDLPLWPRVANLLGDTNVYYYTNLSQENVDILSQEAMNSDLYLDEFLEVKNNFRLYKVKKLME